MSKKTYTPCILAFEGPDGAGKSTQVEKAKEYLEGIVGKVNLIANPGATELGKLVRKSALSEEYGMSKRTRLQAMILALSDAADQCITPSMQRNEWVLLDRWSLSTLIYQGLIESKSSFVNTSERIHNALIDVPSPYSTIVYDVDPKVAWERKNNRDTPDSIFWTFSLSGFSYTA